MLRRDSDATSLATGESVSRVNSQHDPKKVQMDLMMGREAARGCRSLFRPSGSVSWNLAGHYKILVLDPSLPIPCPGMAGAGRSPYNTFCEPIKTYFHDSKDVSGLVANLPQDFRSKAGLGKAELCSKEEYHSE